MKIWVYDVKSKQKPSHRFKKSNDITIARLLLFYSGTMSFYRLTYGISTFVELIVTRKVHLMKERG